jgi:hypothetical protein
MERGRGVKGWADVARVAATLGAWLDDVGAVSALDGEEVTGRALEGGVFSPRK